MNGSKVLLSLVLFVTSFAQPLYCTGENIQNKKPKTFQERAKLFLKGVGLSGVTAASAYLLYFSLLNAHYYLSSDFVKEFLEGDPIPGEGDPSYKAYEASKKANDMRLTNAFLLVTCLALPVAYANLTYKIPQNAFKYLKESYSTEK